VTSALVLQTQDNCPPGLLCDWAEARVLELDVLRVDRWAELPHASSYSFAVLLGSDVSLAGPPPGWAARELAWIAEADAAGVPLLGICFGAQALAAGLGGSVTRLTTPEHAWIELRDRDPGRVPKGPWLALHEDAIGLPPNGKELARNEFGIQAFAVGPHLGVQFHPEVTPSTLGEWVAAKRGLIRTDLLTGAAERCRLAADGAFALFDAFIGHEGPRSQLSVSAGVS